MADNPFLVANPLVPDFSAGLINFSGNKQPQSQQQPGVPNFSAGLIDFGGNKQPQQQQQPTLAQQLASMLQPNSSQQPSTATTPPNTSASNTKASSVVPSEYTQLFNDTESKYGLPTGFLGKVAGVESSYNPHSHNELSGAAGMFQFVPGTAKQYGLSDPYDVAASTDAAGRLAADNKAQLHAALGRDPTAGELYLAHQQGAGGAIRLLLHPDLPAGQLVGSSAISANAGNPNAPASQFIQRWTSPF